MKTFGNTINSYLREKCLEVSLLSFCAKTTNTLQLIKTVFITKLKLILFSCHFMTSVASLIRLVTKALTEEQIPGMLTVVTKMKS